MREYGYRVPEPVVRLGLPREIANRPPFPRPALDARVIGEVTRERVATGLKATAIVEQRLQKT